MTKYRKHWRWLRGTIFGKIISDIVRGFEQDNPMLYGASIAFYTIFSLPALLIFSVFIAGIIFEQQVVEGQIYYYIEELVGQASARQIENILRNAALDEARPIAKAIGVATLTFSATTVFVNIQQALNEIWGVRAKPRKGWLKLIIDRLFSFLLVISLGVLFLGTIIIDTVLSSFGNLLENFFSDYTVYLMQVTSSAIYVTIVTLVFSLIFKLLPDAQVRWRDVLVGAIVTTALFVVGKELIGVYLGATNFSSAYGAAGSLVIILIWVYYSAVIFLIGAEFTKAYSLRVGKEIRPKKNAVKVVKKEIEREVSEAD